LKPLKRILFLILFTGTVPALAQDIHFSQFNASLLNLSPAYTGFFEGDYKLGAVYRNQWSSVPVSYSTFSFNGETRYRINLDKPHAIGGGVLFNSDKAGAAGYGTNQIYFSGSYIHYLRPDSTLILSTGANVGYCSVGFDNSKMTFDKQFNGFEFDKGLSGGESFNRTRRNFFDFNAGMVVQYVFKVKHKISYGLGINHISRPVITYQGNDQSRLDLKFTNCLSYVRPVSYRTDVVMEALFTSQGKNFELVPHVSLKYNLNRDIGQALLGGVCLRARDAAILRLGYNYKTLQSGVAYDVNISRFAAATNRRGGFEIFLNYIFRNEEFFKPRKRACPVFM